MYKVVIFDVDGTLLDSSKGIIMSIKHTIDKFNLKELTDNELTEFVGFSPLKEAFKHFCNIDELLAEKCCEEYRNYYKLGAYHFSRVYNGIYELLAYLKENNFLLGIATYKSEAYVYDLMKYLSLDMYFDVICGADNNNKLKKIDILENCINKLSIEKTSSVMIGDSFHDATAAQKLGVDFIGVTYGFGFKSIDEIKKYKSILCVDNVSQILEFFKNNQLK